MHHELKIEEQYWLAKEAGLKMFEIRHNDRGFQKGDTVSYYVNSKESYLECSGKFEITYVTAFQQKENWVVFGEKLL